MASDVLGNVNDPSRRAHPCAGMSTACEFEYLLIAPESGYRESNLGLAYYDLLAERGTVDMQEIGNGLSATDPAR